MEQLDLDGRVIKKEKDLKKSIPEKCKSCRHCGFIPSAGKDTYYCWTIEGLVENIIDYCNENNHYDVAPEKLEKYFALNTWFFNGKTLAKELEDILKLWDENDSFDDISFVNSLKALKNKIEVD